MNRMLETLLRAKPLAAFLMVSALITVAAPAAAVPTNVTFGKPVTASGALGIISAYGLSLNMGFGDAGTYPPAQLSSLVDGAYLPEGTQWQDGTVWWDEHESASANNVIEIDLNGLYLISFLSIQADNNDGLDIYFRDRLGVWALRGLVGPRDGAGMRERSGSFLNPQEATAIRLDARDGDGFYSLSEFRAMGEAVPEPGSLLLIAIGLAGLGLRRRGRP